MIDTLDLTRHAVFEASAGTGKTHAIGQIVERLLVEKRCRLDQLLIVTFTDKATGELRDRLRRVIENAIDRDPAKASDLQRELDKFDQAAILTIHGFCLRLLQNFAIDFGAEVSFEFEDDAVLRRNALLEVERNDWPAEFGDRLADELRAAGFSRETAAKWESTVLEIAARYRPEHGHRLVPAAEVSPDDPLVKKHRLAVLTIEKLRQRLREGKRQRGTISFDDVIERVAVGLDPEQNPAAANIIAAVREQYRFAIVDEFQDTDVLQWGIFRRLFLEGGSSRLIVVGDPKQAIYGFRGADLPTYRAAVEEMQSRYGAVSCPLDVNWRSTPELIAALNQFFGEGEFFPAVLNMPYVPVQAPPAEKRRTALAHDASGRAAVTLVDVNGDEKTSASQSGKIYADFMAAEIHRLLGGEHGESLMRLKTATGSRPLTARDVCILVSKRSEARNVMAALKRLGLAYSVYKERGVGLTAEAADVGRVLQAIAFPEHERYLVRALMTMFFRVTPGELLAGGGVSAHHPARELMDKWRSFAEQRRWSHLFSSLLEETGVLFRDRDSVEYDRRVANLKLLLGRLQFVGHQRNLDLLELIDVHENSRGGESSDDDLQPQETDEPRVQVATIHSAKGLEFPVVFLTAQFHVAPPKRVDGSYRDAEGRLVFDLPLFAKESPDEDALRERIRLEKLDETRRLYYVALTRPQFKLYLPFMHSKGHAKMSPIVTLLMPSFERSGLAEASGGIAARVVPEPTDLRRRMPNSSPTVAEPSAERLEPLRLALPLPPFDPSISERRVRVESFTSLHKQSLREHAEAFGDRPDRADEIHEPTVETRDPFRGAVFGEMVHEIFEQVSFEEILDATSEAALETGAIGALIAEQTARYLPRLTTRTPGPAVADQCRRLLRGMVWRALRTPLAPLDGMLCELPVGDRLVEMEFLFPSAADSRGTEKFVKGFMDLTFRWQGAVYLLDWKTNVLPSYDAAGLASAMEEAGYHLQSRLYWTALARWLSSHPGGMKMGGVFYLFLRGLDGGAGGVYFESAREVQARIQRDG